MIVGVPYTSAMDEQIIKTKTNLGYKKKWKNGKYRKGDEIKSLTWDEMNERFGIKRENVRHWRNSGKINKNKVKELGKFKYFSEFKLEK